MPEIDDRETWELLEASENGTHTYLKVGRQLNTCDLQDVAIGVSLIHLSAKGNFSSTKYLYFSIRSCGCRTVPQILFGQWEPMIILLIMV